MKVRIDRIHYINQLLKKNPLIAASGREDVGIELAYLYLSEGRCRDFYNVRG